MQPRVEYSVSVPVPIEAAFKAFQDLERLLYRGVYDEATWTEGKPWQVGSRIRYVIVQPLRVAVSAVVTSIKPPHSIDLLNHGLGVTAEQHVSFSSDHHGGTRIRVTMNLIGKSFELSEEELTKAADFILKDSLDTVVASCKKRKHSASH
jgi:uncharacterized protein YndB with AHSA1/START domain